MDSFTVKLSASYSFLCASLLANDVLTELGSPEEVIRLMGILMVFGQIKKNGSNTLSAKMPFSYTVNNIQANFLRRESQF